MTLLLADGFEGYTTNGDRTVLDPVYDYTALSGISVSEGGVVAEGRVSGKCSYLKNGNGVTDHAAGHELLAASLTSDTTWIVGFAVYVDHNGFLGLIEPRIPLLQFHDSFGFVMTTFYMAAGNVNVVSGGLTSNTKIGFGTARLFTRVWHFIEMKVTFSITSGAVEVWVDGKQELSASGQTAPTVSAEIIPTRAVICGSSRFRRILIDDLYICDSLGSFNTTFLGEIGIRRLDTTADGTTNDFTPNTGTNFEAVDEDDPDGDTTYVESSTVGHNDLYAIDDVASTPTSIAALQVVSTGKSDDGGAKGGRNMVLSNSIEGLGSTYDLTTSYVPYQSIYETDPDSGVAWVKGGVTGGVDRVEIGVEVVS